MDIYRGVVSHYRNKPAKHGFKYSIFMVMLDVDRIDESMPWYYWPILGHNKFAIAAFHDKHHISKKECPDATSKTSLSSYIRDIIGKASSGKRPTGRIQVLTNLSYFGYCFNPVSFYYIWDEQNPLKLNGVVAEVTNTPWNEMHYYILNGDVDGVTMKVLSTFKVDKNGDVVKTSKDDDMKEHRSSNVGSESFSQRIQLENEGAVDPTAFDELALRFSAENEEKLESKETRDLDTVPNRLQYGFKKSFHVSPFMAISDQVYEWIFSAPLTDVLLVQSQNTVLEELQREKPPQPPNTAIKMPEFLPPGRIFLTQLRMVKEPFSLARFMYYIFILYPFLTVRVQLWIHYEAFRLFMKGVSLYPHPEGSQNFFTRTVEALFTPIAWLLGK
jgi:DUF1365 family protein